MTLLVDAGVVASADKADPRRVAAQRVLAPSRESLCVLGPVLDVEERYADFDLGLADCSLIVLAERLRTTRIATFDERHFRAVTPLQGGAFTLLPGDG